MKSSPPRNAFTLLEILVATSVLILMLTLTLQIVNQSARIWSRSSDKMESFQGARNGFGLITRTLSQATLNAYLDYDSATSPQYYVRRSALGFYAGPAGENRNPGTPGSGQCVFFQFPGGYALSDSYAALDTLLNGCGYYVSFSRDPGLPSHIPLAKAPYRYRLMQLLVPTEKNAVDSAHPNAWYAATGVAASVLADNVIALVLRPQDPSAAAPNLTADYLYDSTLGVATYPQPVTSNQLPPVLMVTLIAISESSARRLDTGSGQPPAAIAAALAGRFRNTAQYTADLAAVGQALNAQHIAYEVFSGAVPLRESKWSK
ncbi:Verru_Chthon cassette protein C [Verrucomicrobium sp. GAS474]|uniref:hypothetical protein n=1 Tax=Verrucomicrobium sp. GAS474 TaxID=1882831 RepID=UPI00087A3997|nr:hypothetical protein [Verrucomicrobium sp. GAS474]SDT92825.1 Verru_Chthon cassette protein C [Verrucomicrobium sp. GAS474]